MSHSRMFELRNLTKRYKDTDAVRNVTLHIGQGRATVLIGPSGCGKSTLLRLMMGLVIPDEGEVIFEGSPLATQNARVQRLKMGYVIQDGGLFPHLTARQNITIMAEYLKWSMDQIQSRLDELIGLTRFPADGLDRYPAQLSGGQRQRVSLMRALTLDPDVLLMDEPLGALDPMIRSRLQEELKSIFQSLGKTVVFVTHDLAEAGFLADNIVLLRKGELIQQGTFADLLSNPASDFVSEFVQAQRGLLRQEHWEPTR